MSLRSALNAPRRALALVPLAVLAFDIALEPFLFSTETAATIPNVETFLGGRSVDLGRLRGHEVTVSLGGLADAGYLDGVVTTPERPFGLVIAHFAGEETAATSFGPVGRAVHGLLAAASPDEAEAFRQALRSTAANPVGNVTTFRVDETVREDARLPFDAVHVILLDAQGSGPDYLGNVRRGLEATMDIARSDRASGLLVTTLGMGPRYRPADPSEFFDVLLSSIPEGVHPRVIDVSFFDNWPTAYLSENIQDFNAAWARAADEPLAGRIHRAQFRFALLWLSICLLASSRVVPLTPLNALFISIFYLGVVLGAGRLLDFVLAGFGPNVLFFGTLAFQAFMALFFPQMMRLNPKGVFDRAK